MKLLVFFALIAHSLVAHPLDLAFEEFQGAHIGMCVIDLRTGEEIYQRNGDQFFIPASLQKIPVALAAMHFLGDDFRFSTNLSHSGNIDAQGTLKGDILIEPSGDPTLSLDIFSTWQREIAALGIKSIEGRVLIDVSGFETLRASRYWNFEDLGNYYGAGISAFNIHHNQYLITFKPGQKVGDAASVLSIDPPVPGLIFHNEVTMGVNGSGDQVYVFGSEGSHEQFFRGTLALDHPTYTVKAALPDPLHFAAQRLQECLKPSGGVELTHQKQKGAVLISQHQSEPLHTIVSEMQRLSVNLYAEFFVKRLGGGYSALGAKKIEQFLQESFHVKAQVRDGAGMAHTNFVTPRGFTSLLYQIRGSSVYATLPLKGNVRAKTGTMSSIYNLAGYLDCGEGREYAFSIFCNHFLYPKKRFEQEARRFLSLLESADKQSS